MFRRKFTTTGDHSPPWLTIAICAVAIIIAVVFVGVTTAGAVTRPDYAGLGVDQGPDVAHVEFDGAGHARVAGINPGAVGPWLVATFHVPNPANWHDGQGDPTDTAVLPAGPFDLTLDCVSGASQVDVWLEGQDQPYASAITLDCGGTPAPVDDVTPDSFGVTDTPAADTQDISLAAVEVGVSSGGERATTEPPSEPAALSAARTITTLPDTGAGGFVLPVGAFLLILAGTNFLGASWWKGRRS